jgi:aryl-alcohol dehydrogenase-like predicted oxidoreductase
MRKVTLADTDLRVSRFIFGTAGLFNAGGPGRRQALLESAFDHGLTHFDTAPYYGFGSAERAMKPFLARHPDATVTTKVGIYSPGGERQPDALVFLRKAAGRLVPAISRPTIDWTLSRAREALDGSLRRLGRGHIDLYALHEPDFRLIHTEEWSRWLQDEVTAGRVRHFGVALEAGGLAPFLKSRSPLGRVVQTTDSLEGREADVLARHGRPMQITYGYVSDAIRRDGEADVRSVLAKALERNRDGAIIVSTRRPLRMGQYAELARMERE